MRSRDRETGDPVCRANAKKKRNFKILEVILKHFCFTALGS